MAKVQPRGVRNNNPMNLRYNANNPWRGRATWSQRTEAQRHETAFEVFESPEMGIRAGVRTLETYFDKYQADTITKLIARWAPRTENDVAAYVQAVSESMNTSPALALDLQNRDVMRALVLAIIKHENGIQPYSDAVIDKGIALAGYAPVSKAIAKSRVVAGSVVSMVGIVANSVPELHDALAPLRDYVPHMPMILAGLATAGALYAIYARTDDKSRRIT